MCRGNPDETWLCRLRRWFAAWWARNAVRPHLGGRHGGGAQSRPSRTGGRTGRRRACTDGGTTDAVDERLAEAYVTDERSTESPHSVDGDRAAHRPAGTVESNDAGRRAGDPDGAAGRGGPAAARRTGRGIAGAAVSSVERRYRALVHFAFGRPETPTGKRFFRFGVLLAAVSAAYLTSGVLLVESVPPVLGSTVGALAVGGAAVASMGIGLVLVGLTLTRTSPDGH